MVLALLILAAYNQTIVAIESEPMPTCSKARLVILNTKNLIYSQNFKNSELKEAICCKDYVATKFWLEHGADFHKTYGGFPTRFEKSKTPALIRDESILYLPVILYIVYPITEYASDEQMLELLKDYGIKEIRLQLKSGFNKVCIC